MPVPAKADGWYEGARGEAYLSYQEPIAGLMAEMNRPLFEPYVQPHDVVVDFGCGSGHMLLGLTARRKIGIEINPRASRLAAERGLETVANASELEREQADVVISSHALEHVRSPFDQLVSLRSLLKPGGRIVILTPLDDWRTQRRHRVEPNHHLFTWTPQLLGNLLVEAGFEVGSTRIIRRAVPTRLGLARLPSPLHRAAELLWSALRRRRQLLVTAVRPAR